MPAPRITVVGSYATGLVMKVPRIPCSGETILGSGYRADYGGKGSNQAVGCARLGAQVSFVAKLGTDSFAEMALGLYRAEGVDIRHVKQTADAPTGVGFIAVETSSGSNSIVLDPGANELLTAVDVRESEAAMDGAAVVLTQLEIPTEAAEAALGCGRARGGAITVLNPAPVRPLPRFVLQLADVITPNETEAKVLAGRDPTAPADPEKIAMELMDKGAKQVVMTLGENGALIVAGSSRVHVPAIPMRAVDTTGAGDAFNAGLAMALAAGQTLETAVRFAVITGAMAVTKEGVIPALPRRSEVLSFCAERGVPTPAWLQARASSS